MRGVIRSTDSLIVGPTVPPMSIDHARRHIKAITLVEDVLISGWILAAAQYFMEQTGRAITTETRELWIDAFPRQRRIELPHPPLQSVTSVLYVDSNGNLASFDDGASPAVPSYLVKAPQGPYAARGWIEPTYGNCWPTARCESGAVRIQYTCGYGSSDNDVPHLVQAILCYLVGHFDQYRSAVVEARRGALTEMPFGVQMMLDGFKYSAYPSDVLRGNGTFDGFAGGYFGGAPWLG